MSIKDRLVGYHYTTKVVIRCGEWKELEQIAKSENRNFRKQHRIDRCVVYPIPGTMARMGQLCILR